MANEPENEVENETAPRSDNNKQGGNSPANKAKTGIRKQITEAAEKATREIYQGIFKNFETIKGHETSIAQLKAQNEEATEKAVAIEVQLAEDLKRFA